MKKLTRNEILKRDAPWLLKAINKKDQSDVSPWMNVLADSSLWEKLDIRVEVNGKMKRLKL